MRCGGRYSTLPADTNRAASQYKINALGVIHSISAFLALLRAAPTRKIVVISTGEADPKFVKKSGTAHMSAYGMTKAAALIATTKYAVKLQDEGFVVVAVSPGLVDNSDTVGENGTELPSTSRTNVSDGVLQVIQPGMLCSNSYPITTPRNWACESRCRLPSSLSLRR